MTPAADSIADVLEALAERSVFWKGEVQRLEHQNQAHWGAAEASREQVQILIRSLEKEEARRVQLGNALVELSNAAWRLMSSLEGQALNDLTHHSIMSEAREQLRETLKALEGLK